MSTVNINTVRIATLTQFAQTMNLAFAKKWVNDLYPNSWAKLIAENPALQPAADLVIARAAHFLEVEQIQIAAQQAKIEKAREERAANRIEGYHALTGRVYSQFEIMQFLFKRTAEIAAHNNFKGYGELRKSLLGALRYFSKVYAEPLMMFARNGTDLIDAYEFVRTNTIVAADFRNGWERREWQKSWYNTLREIALKVVSRYEVLNTALPQKFNEEVTEPEVLVAEVTDSQQIAEDLVDAGMDHPTIASFMDAKTMREIQEMLAEEGYELAR